MVATDGQSPDVAYGWYVSFPWQRGTVQTEIPF